MDSPLLNSNIAKNDYYHDMLYIVDFSGLILTGLETWEKRTYVELVLMYAHASVGFEDFRMSVLTQNEYIISGDQGKRAYDDIIRMMYETIEEYGKIGVTAWYTKYPMVGELWVEK